MLDVCRARKVMKMTFDSFNSEYSIQKLHMAGISTEQMSVSNQAQLLYYSVSKTLIDQGLLVMPRDSYWSTTAEAEFTNLIQIPSTGRIDHPKSGSKDISDAISNAVYNCYIHMAKSGLMSAIAGGVATIGSQAIGKVAQSQGKNVIQIGSGVRRLRAAKSRGVA